MAQRYWINGTGTWDGSSTANWAATSGGTPGASVPTAADDVFFDNNSSIGTTAYTVTIGALLTCNNISIDGPGGSGTITLAGTAGINYSGNFLITSASKVTSTHTGTLISAGTSGTQTFTTGGVVLSNNFSIGAGGSTVSFLDNLTTSGTFFTLNGPIAATSNTITFTGASITVSGTTAPTFYNLTYTPTTPAKTNKFVSSLNVTVTNLLTLSNGATATNRIEVTSGTPGLTSTWTAAAISTSNTDWRDITGAGAASWNMSADAGGSGDCGGNTMKALGSAAFTTATTQHWVNSSSGSWSNAANWTSRVPLPQDDATFDIAMGTSQTITQDMPRLGKNISFSATTWTTGLTLTNSTQTEVFGNYILKSGLTLSGANPLIMSGRSSYGITTAGVTMLQAVTVSAYGGTAALNDNYTGTSMTLTAGTLDMSSRTVVLSSTLTSNASSNVHTLNLTGTTLTVATCSIGNTANHAQNPTLTINTSTAITVNATSANGVFAGGDLTFNDVTINLAAGSQMNASTNLTGSNTFRNLTINRAASGNYSGFAITQGTTQTVSGTFTAAGNSTTSRLLLYAIDATNLINNAVATISAATVAVSYTDFLYIAGTGGGNWNISGATGGSGNCGGNSGITFTTPTTQHWVTAAGGTWSTLGNWTSRVPLPQDSVAFDCAFGTSSTITCDLLLAGGNWDFTGATWTTGLTVTNGLGISIFGNVKLKSGTLSVSGALFLRGMGTQTLDCQTNSFGGLVTFVSAGTYSLTGDATFNGVTFTGGTFDAAGYGVNVVSGNTTLGNTFTELKLGAGVWNFSGTSSTTVNFLAATPTVTPSTSTLKFTSTSSNAMTLNGGTHTFYDVWFARGTSTGSNTLTGAMTFHNITDDGTGAKTITWNNYITATGNINLTTSSFAPTFTSGLSCANLTITGPGATTPTLIGGSVIGSVLTFSVSGTVTTSYTNWRDITGTGGASWNLSGATGGSGDCGGNSGITFTTSTTQHWVGTIDNSGTGTWSTVGNWTSRIPLPQDDIRFDYAFGTSCTISGDMTYLGRNIDFTGATWTTALTWTPGAKTIMGSMTLISGLTMGTSNTIFGGRGAYTWDSKAVSINGNIVINAPGGTYTQSSATTFTSLRSLTVTNGGFTTGGFGLTVDTVSIGAGGTLTLGTDTLTLSGTGNIWVNNGSCPLSAYTIKVTNTGTASTTTFAGNNKTYGALWYSRGTSTQTHVLTGSNSFTSFKDDGTGTHTITFADWTRNRYGTFLVSGIASHLITLTSAGGSNPYAFLKTASGVVNSDYLSIQHCVAAPMGTWYAGTHSTNNQGTSIAGSGWIFTAVNSVFNFGHWFYH